MSFLGLDGKVFVVFGVSNKKSVGFAVGRLLQKEGAKVVFVVHTEARKTSVEKIAEGAPIFVCDVEKQEDILRVAEEVKREFPRVHGIVHSVAFANYSEGPKVFHETPRRDFLQAMSISCFSLVEISNAFRESLDPRASIITISISTTRMAAENYGYMAPVKAALDSTIVFLAKSFSAFSEIRFNAICPGLLKTSSSAGIPGYVDSYLFAEKVIPRGKGVTTEEVANTAAFILSERSSGINAQLVVIDAGMSMNYFDREVVRSVVRNG